MSIGKSALDTQANIFTEMVMSEVIKDKERLALQEFKEDEYGSKEVVRKKSLDSDDDFNEDEDEDPVLREI